ncbi:MAG: DinB family protein [Gemmatimonadaceae bacterium]|nr:DinB family protein [Gemmatimonadaceae bacterium]
MRRLRLTTLLASVCVPAVLAAQAPAAPQANPITAAFKGRILSAHRNLAQAFDSIPEAKFGYKPTPAQLTIGYIAQHIASDSYLFCNTFGAMKSNEDAKDRTTPDSVKAMWPKAELVTKLKASFAFCAQALDQLTDATLSESTTMSFNGTSRSVTRAAMALGHALDLTDHYSQLEAPRV